MTIGVKGRAASEQSFLRHTGECDPQDVGNVVESSPERRPRVTIGVKGRAASEQSFLKFTKQVQHPTVKLFFYRHSAVI